MTINRNYGDSDCCDCCPYTPTCEELRDFDRSIGLLEDDWGDDGYDPEPGSDYVIEPPGAV